MKNKKQTPEERIPDENFFPEGEVSSGRDPELRSGKTKMTRKQGFIAFGVILALFTVMGVVANPFKAGYRLAKESTDRIPCDELTAGDRIFFEKAVFTGTYPEGKFSHLQLIEGKITKKSYWKEKNMIMLTVKTDSGQVYRISNLNVYRNSCERELWDDESKRAELLERENQRFKADHKSYREGLQIGSR